jgi:DNA polymerase
MGEQDLVLDNMSVEEVMKLLGAPGRGTAPTASVAAKSPLPMPDRPRATNTPLAGVPVQKPTAPEPPKAATASIGPIIVGGGIAEAAGATHASRLETLDDIAAAVAKCTLCGLHSTAKNPVPGEGNPQAKFVCVGEAPGATEDETGRPFVGQAGQLLTKIIEAIDFKREDVFICNVLTHRPPGNRNPAPDEITACSPFLLQQLALLRPHVILALGTFAAQTLLQTTQPIGKLRGQIHRFYGVPLVVTYHPAALLRNPNWKRPTWEDVQLAKRVFDNAGGA